MHLRSMKGVNTGNNTRIGLWLTRWTIYVLVFAFCPLMAQAQAGFRHKAGPYGLMPNGMQATHTQTNVIYATPGTRLRLYRPDKHTYQSYLRWYDFDKDSAAVNISLASNDSADYNFMNEGGWYSYDTKISSTDKTKNLYEIFYVMQDSVYRVACDQSAYKDYVSSPDYVEPTLSTRLIYELRPASEIAAKADACSGDGTTGEYMEVYNMMAPTGCQLYIGPKYTFEKITIKGQDSYSYEDLCNYYYNVL